MSFLSDRSEAVRELVEAVRDNPAGTALARLIVDKISWARFEGLGDWDQARYVAHFALEAGWTPPVALNPDAPGEAPLSVGDWVLVTLPPDDPYSQDSGKVGKIIRRDDDLGFIVHFPEKDRPEGGLRAVASELTPHAAPATEPAGEPEHA